RMRLGGISSEVDLDQLHCTRLTAQFAGLIRKYRGKFVLTRKCRDMLAQKNNGGIYLALFKAYTTQFNWSYRDRYPEAPIVQHSLSSICSPCHCGTAVPGVIFNPFL
ncbi:MAG: hypothetical protein QNK22_02700, partial [Xanthomonadales bacterium]|nr:hypothetical protein [Xanthomonadales bacterium]